MRSADPLRRAANSTVHDPKEGIRFVTAAPELRSGLAALGHQLESIPDSYMDFGAGQFIARAEGGYVAGSDPRRDGQAAGF